MNFEDRYGRLDRLLHDVAFRAGRAQQALADVEEILHRDQLGAIDPGSPVFVTALPRSGTTILLKILADCGHFASHTYRDMPFVLCPMLWRRFSARFAADGPAVERAHGDGLEVSADSPEAFEEMIWKRFWPDRYRGDRIRPWTRGEENAEFDAFFEVHMRKVIALRRDGPSDERRYVSKNNLNIARLGAPPRPLRRGVFVVPFREPVQQAASMLRQHRRFTELHREDDFVRRYMEAIGHHEFGEGLKPVDFGGWLDRTGWDGAGAGSGDGAGTDPAGLEFWLRYWTAAYRHVLDRAGADGAAEIRLVPYGRLTGEPEEELGRLAGAIDVPASDLVPAARRLQAPRRHDADLAAVEESALREARTVHAELGSRAGGV